MLLVGLLARSFGSIGVTYKLRRGHFDPLREVSQRDYTPFLSYPVNTLFLDTRGRRVSLSG